MLHLLAIEKRPVSERERTEFPFNVPAIAQWDAPLRFTSPVTFLAGENGSGKSTFLEALACHTGLPAAGQEEANRDPSLDRVRPLGRKMKAAWTQRPTRGFFLRAEDFFGFVQRLKHMARELQSDLARVNREYGHRSRHARQLARMPFARELSDMLNRYGGDLDAQSHGEGFLAFFQARFVPGGLYLLDEPETPLSPLRQLGLLSLLKEMAEERNAQFVIATHSPILMAYPGAAIWSFDQPPIRCVAYEELEHVRFTRAFLTHTEAYLRHL